MWTDLWQDARYAMRGLWKTPAFTATAVVTLALGIGANTAIFSVISAVLLRPLPYRDASRLVFVWSTSDAFPREPLTPGRLVDFREQMTSLSAFAGISHVPLNFTSSTGSGQASSGQGAGDPERISGSSVSSSFFDVLGVPALIGDTFHTNAADERGVVMSHRLWSTRFGSDPTIVGQTIVLNGTTRTVLGVMPASFEWPAITPTPGTFGAPELWVPGTSRDIPRMPVDRGGDLAANRQAGYLRAVARLDEGVTIEQARREAEIIAARLGRQYPNEDGGRSATVIPLREQFVGHVRKPMMMLLAAVGFVLAIACANIASLLLGRSATRRRELAVRLALGASHARLARQLLTESTVLAIGSASIGLTLAFWASRWLTTLSPTGFGDVQAILDARVLVFTAAIAVATGLLCGLAPAWHVSTGALTSDLADGGARGSAGPRAGRTRDALVVVEIAVALVLLVASGLMLRSFHALSSVNTGIVTQNLLTFEMFLSGERAQQQQRQVEFYDEALRRISAVPGVTHAGAAVTLPIGGDDFAAGFSLEGRPLPPPGQEPRAGYQVVTPGYFRAMGIPIVAGRDFAPGDTRDATGVVMVNETFARQHWPGDNPLGRRMKIGRGDEPWLTVVGVVGDIRHLGPATPPRPEFYQPHSQRSFAFMAFVVRTAVAPRSVVPALRRVVTTLDPTQPISGVDTMEDHIARALARPRILSTLVAMFGALALVLAVVGIYGVMAYAVAQRTQEIAIRTALGASAADVVRLLLGKAAWLAAAGVVCGLALTAVATRGLSGLLFEVTTTDGRTYTAVLALLVSVALLAAAIPAFRAARIDGARALRG